MAGSAKVEMKGPRAWKAAILTQRLWSLNKLRNRGLNSDCLTVGEQTQETGMKTSAHAFLTPQTPSSHK